ncbi:maleylpyruvate isomerase family mycothiol-dependent enzyme [Streptomyces sp. TRM 70351]|uniref:maleylpyruvate isomerase family mycothiol-dependent enzyme n=1 Tax=Streptomyces sp. TRM 70351 TaxID=3116552 RepID=UPI002E7BAFE4|nr:maleylpyruvate isomerase family mycothiol-dependent enzyme [Streptomyces sp. TRM 70351]MEE1927230.1 maleylpyruvate isomerase family mycothiol-dependent enzyme [Streptomyces sp. TRM 70351]
MTMTYGRYCDELLSQTRALCAVLTTGDLSGRVPTCPDWTLGELATHVGQAHRWMTHIVRTRATAEVAEADVPDIAGPGTSDAAALTAWLGETASSAADALRAAGPGTPVWTWSGDRHTDFWARRMTHETAVHRADACGAAGIPFTLAPDVAVDTIDEWLDIVSSPELQAHDPRLRELRERAGCTLRLHATDAPDDLGAEWLIELGADGIGWRRGHAAASVALRGPLTDVALALCRRLPPTSGRVEVVGDAELLDYWLARTSFE